MNVRATYRLQFHKGFTFTDAEAIVPYLAELGISHLYASPIIVAQPGSMHGYDVVDPTRINPELGGEDAFRSLVTVLRAHDMGAIIDIVPNHMGVAGQDNPWWQDVLEHGPSSEFAHFFDIDWSRKLLLPFLGTSLRQALDENGLTLREDEHGVAVWAYDTHRFPIRPEDREEAYRNIGGAPSFELLERQHWRLAWWRSGNDALNWRRFFTISELAGLRTEDPAVFEAVHALPFRLFAEGLIDGVRVDHVDGLTDPAGYCRRLRERLAELVAERPSGLSRDAYIVVEKILAHDEPLSDRWSVDGTSGYDFMAEVSALLHDPQGEAPLTRYWAEVSGRSAIFEEEELQARRDMLAWEFEGQLSSCVDAFAALAASAPKTEALTPGMLRRAIERLLWVFPVYRTYGTGTDAPSSDEAIRDIARERALPLAAPGERGVIDTILSCLAGVGPGDATLAAEAVRRFQQLSAPIAAKAVEDTAFYRFAPLLSRNDVGFDPAHFAMEAEAFHERMVRRRSALPRSMLATATHDHKRGEDVRARLAVLSEMSEEWIESVERWNEMNAAIAEGLGRADLYPLYQTLFGAWPTSLGAGDFGGLADYVARVVAWQEKALREAKLRSSWAAPNERYEARARQFVETILDPIHSREFLEDFVAFGQRLRPAGEANGLVQALLHCTMPGVPDIYQGAEFADLSLVDPDNRRPVDFVLRQRTIMDASADNFDARKQALIASILCIRRGAPALWSEGSYEPIAVEGSRAAHVFAFARRHGDYALVGAALLHCGREIVEAGAAVPDGDWWGDTRIVLPPNITNLPFRNVRGERDAGIPGLAADLFGRSPVYFACHGPATGP
jgi:(1->4)-alpha-D-glucan 1-alpha-D-glucosylmutase